MVASALKSLIQDLLLTKAQPSGIINDYNWGQEIAQLALQAEYEHIKNHMSIMDDEQLIHLLQARLNQLYQDLESEFQSYHLKIITEIQLSLEARGYIIEYYPVGISENSLYIRKYR